MSGRPVRMSWSVFVAIVGVAASGVAWKLLYALGDDRSVSVAASLVHAVALLVLVALVVADSLAARRREDDRANRLVRDMTAQVRVLSDQVDHLRRSHEGDGR